MSNAATQFKKGQSGNLNGRPKESWTMTGLIKEALEERDKRGVPMKKHIARRLVQLANHGEIVAIKEINNRVDGMPIQEVKQEIDGDVTIHLDGLVPRVTAQANSGNPRIT